MIRRNGTYEAEVRENMRGGLGEARIEHLWRADELHGRARLFSRITLQPGCSIGFHEHLGEAEVFVVIRGEARMLDGDRDEILRAGDTILTSEQGHSVEAVGEQTLEMLAVILPEPKG